MLEWLQNLWTAYGRHIVFAAVCLLALGVLSANLLSREGTPPPRLHPQRELASDDFRNAVIAVDTAFQAAWSEAKLEAAPKANDLTIARRLSLALTGTVPSLEEIRTLESLPPQTDRVQWWVSHLLEDRRYADYMAERLARAFVGTENGPFLVYRRRRFTSWLSDRLQENMPYDELVRHLLADDGLWTDTPAVNFVSATIEPNIGPDKVKLAARTTRAFLGLRIDCVQCHDDNLGGPWKQQDFHQLAAYFAGADSSLFGIRDDQRRKYQFKYLKAKEETEVAPQVPFAQECAVSSSEKIRERLADWVTHPKNGAFGRAIAGRMWALVTGRPLTKAVDAIPLEQPPMSDGAVARLWPVLDVLGRDFQTHGNDLRRLIRLIASIDAFHRESKAGFELTAKHDEVWASYPLTRLRPEQVSGSVLQAAQLHTIDAGSNLIVRITRYGQEDEFVKRYGDTGDDEFDDHGGTIPQRLLMMNGQMVKDRTEQDAVNNASTSIAMLSPDNAKAVETAYLVTLTRRPTQPEADYFAKWLGDAKEEQRMRKIEDLCWMLLNSTEFSWNH